MGKEKIEGFKGEDKGQGKRRIVLTEVPRLASRIRGRGVFYGGKAIHTIELVSHVAPSSRSHPFDTALRAYSGQALRLLSGQAVEIQEATSKPDIRVAEYCLVVNHLILWLRGDRQRSEVMPWVT